MHQPSNSPPSPRGRKLLIAVGLLLLIGVAAFLVRSRSNSATPKPQASNAPRPTPVVVAEVTSRNLPLTRDGLGSVTAFYTVSVRAQVAGRLDRVHFKEGEPVKRGQVLAEIDPRPFAIQLQSAQAALARDEATLENARLNSERYQRLADQNLIPGQQLSDQQASVSQLTGVVAVDRAQIAAAKLNLDYTSVRSPLDGVAGIRQVDPGNYIALNDANGLVVVTQMDPIAILFSLPQDDLPLIREAMAKEPPLVEALDRDGTTVLASGKLTAIDNAINGQTATLRLKAEFANKNSSLWPNQFVKARLHVGTLKNATVVPANAIQRGPQGSFVYVVKSDNTVEVRPVTLAPYQGDAVATTAGLQRGERVVTEGQAQLKPGASVEVRTPLADAGKTPSPSSALPTVDRAP